MTRPRRRPLAFETRLTLFVLALGAPALVFGIAGVHHLVHDETARGTLDAVLGLAWIVAAFGARERVVRPLQTLSNMLAAMREGDTSIRARGADTGSAMGLALWELNSLTDTVRRRKLESLEAVALLRHVMDSIDVAVFAFDPERRLRLINSEGERLIGEPAERALGRDAASLGLAEALEGDTPRLLELSLTSGRGRWELRRGPYRQDGLPHELVFLSDLTRALREEERVAFLRVIRVLSHEINNSLAPIQSIAGSLRTILDRGAREATREEDLRGGLQVIENRAQALGRFMHAYARLARLPAPTPAPVDVEAWVRRVAALETRLAVSVEPGPAIVLSADGDQ